MSYPNGEDTDVLQISRSESVWADVVHLLTPEVRDVARRTVDTGRWPALGGVGGKVYRVVGRDGKVKYGPTPPQSAAETVAGG